MVLQLVDSSICLDAIAFNVDLDVWPNYRAQFVHALYSLDINDYQGRQKVQLIINKMKAKVEDLVD